MTSVILITLTTFGIGLGGLAFTKQQAPIFALLVVAGASMVICVALCNTSIQQRIPDALRGRVLSMYTFAFSGFLPFGNLTGGILAEHRGLQPTMLVLGGGLVVTAMIAMIVSSRAQRGIPNALAQGIPRRLRDSE